jgi:hypothetical protein
VTCPRCRQSAASHGHRPRTPVSPFGTLDDRRACYSCRRRGRGPCPFDEAAGPGPRQLTPAAEPLTALAGGIAAGFERGRHPPADRAALRLSEATVPRATGDVGRRRAGSFAAGGTPGPRTGRALAARRPRTGRQGAGARRRAEGTQALCPTRALYRSEAGQWPASRPRQDTNRKPVQQPK